MLQPTICLKWVLNGNMHMSPDFELLQSTWFMDICLRKTSDASYIILAPRDLPHKADALSHLSKMEFMLKIGERSYYKSGWTRAEIENPLIIFRNEDITKDEILSLENVDEWTVLCVFEGEFTESVSLQAGNRKATISSNGFSLTADKCVQVSQEVPQNIEALSSDISKLLEDGIVPDFELKCGGRTFPVHRSVLAARSEVWRAMFHNQMQESQIRSCFIQDMEVYVLESLLKFLYSGKLDDISEDTIPKLCEAAEKYAVRSLIEVCCYWLIRNLSEENCINFLKIADLHSYLDLRCASVSFILENPRVFKSEPWLTFSKEHPSIAMEVLQKYAESSCQ